ncbi:MAG: DUF5702 domain-containing protein [Lachnotalea sp.]
MNHIFYKKGHITVFLSLILTLILSLVCTTIESARIQGVQMQLQNVTDMGIFSLFGEYSQELLELYDLFFIDTAYGTNDGSTERVNAQIKKYAEYNVNADKELFVFKYADMWVSEIEEVTTNNYVLASDNNGKAYYSQAVEYMKDKIGITIAERLINQYDSSIMDQQQEFESSEDNNTNELTTVDAAKDEYNTNYELALEEAEGDESKVEMDKPPEVENPVDSINLLKNTSILQLVMKDYSTLSQKKITEFSQISSKRTLKSGDGTFEAQSNNALNKALFNEYLFEKFPNLLQNESSDVLNYQSEYILCGKKSDKKNLEGVVNQLLLMREGINFAYLVSDTVKRTEATELATLLIGYLCIPALIPILAATILLAWAFAESIIEVRMLLSGKKVGLLKNSNNWNLQLSNLVDLSNQLDSGNEDRHGIDYEGYLKILTYFESQNKKVMRSLDLIELSIQDKLSNNNFKIDNCTQGFTSTIDYKVGSLFLRLPFRTLNRGSSSYNYSITRDFCYY